MMHDFRSEYKVLSQDELETIKMRMDANPDLLQDPEIVNRMIATLEQQQAYIENLITNRMHEQAAQHRQHNFHIAGAS